MAHPAPQTRTASGNVAGNCHYQRVLLAKKSFPVELLSTSNKMPHNGDSVKVKPHIQRWSYKVIMELKKFLPPADRVADTMSQLSTLPICLW